MRRTDQEFKIEILRRSESYRARQRQLRKKLLTAAGCFVMVIFGFGFMLPLFAGGGGTSKSTADRVVFAPEAALQDAYYNGSADTSRTEMSSSTGYGREEDAPSEPEENGTMDTGEPGSISRRYNVISIEIRTLPEADAHERFFTNEEKIAAIENAIEWIHTFGETGNVTALAGGIVYEITITYEDSVVCYQLFGNVLYSENDDCWISVDQYAYDQMVSAITQESDSKS